MVKFELMDGSPIRNETVPIRLFLKPYDLTPTYASVNNQFSVKYYLNLVLEDNEKNRFFKQKEVIFHRIKKKPRKQEEPGVLSQIGQSEAKDLKEGEEKDLKESEEKDLKESEEKGFNQDLDNEPVQEEINQGYNGEEQGEMVEDIIKE